MNYDLVLQQIKDSYMELLGSNLVGIYVHGSIAFNCYNPEKSDIDYIVVVNNAIPLDVKKELMKETFRINKSAPQKGLEMSIVLKEHCKNFTYPTPFELHYSNGQKDWYESNPEQYCEKMNGDDKDLAAHFTVIKKVGMVLYGEPINDVFGEVLQEYYFDSIKCDIESAKEIINSDPVYFVLNLCRVLAYKQDGLILSKEQGGDWGLKNIDSKYGTIIKTCLDSYMTDKIMPIDSNNALEYCDYVLHRIYE